MYTKENLCGGAIRRKSIRGWGYSLSAALFLIFMAVIFLAAKWPEEGLRKLTAETMEAEGQAWELLRISEKDRQLWKEKFSAASYSY